MDAEGQIAKRDLEEAIAETWVEAIQEMPDLEEGFDLGSFHRTVRETVAKE